MIEITVPDMTCGHCAAVVAKAVRETAAAARCEIDVPAKQVRIASAGTAGDFIAAIAAAGYSPVLAGTGT